MSDCNLSYGDVSRGTHKSLLPTGDITQLLHERRSGDEAQVTRQIPKAVETRRFDTLTFNDIASMPGVSRSLSRDWALAKAGPIREISREEFRGAAALGNN